MSEGVPAAGPARLRLFVAVWPPPTVVAALDALPRPDVAGLRWTGREQWHVTLRFLGHTGVAAAVEAFRTVEVGGTGGAGGAPVVAELGPVTGRFGRRILHVPVRGLEAVAAATVAATGEVGEPPEDRPFAGHVTLARARERRGVDLSALVGLPVAGRWPVGELTLVASRPHRDGSRYEVVERLALSG